MQNSKHFCEEYPELAKKLEFEDRTKIDIDNSAVYNSEKGVAGGAGNKQNNFPENEPEQRGNTGISKLFRRTTMNDPDYRRFRRIIQENNAQQLHLPLNLNN